MDYSAGLKPRLGWLIRAVVVFLSLLGTCDMSTLCGMQLLEPKLQDQKQVKKGDRALPGPWLWLISIQIYTPRGPRHSCDGAIIDALWILTAAHCFSAKKDSFKSWKVVLGVTDLSRLPDTVQIRSIKRIVFHQDYNQFTAFNDIALIELDSPVNFDNYVQPICLPPISMDSPAFSSCYISSWSSEGTSTVVFEVKANIVTTMVCNSSRWYNGGMNPHTLCANLEDRDFCQGNFGGLLTCKTLANSPYYIVGISNFETDCAKAKHPIIYTAIQQFVEWISTKLMGTESTPEEEHLQNHNHEDISSASVTHPTEETIIMEPPYVPQDTVPIILEVPYVPDETTPLLPTSPFIPREPPLVAVDKSFPLRPKSADRAKYHFPKTISLPPQYVPPHAKVPAHLQPPYLPPEPSVHTEPPYILPETTASLEPPYTLRETTKSLELPYIPVETTSSLEPPYTLQETTRSLEPPYIPLETTASLEPPYTLQETTSSLEPPYTPRETSVALESPYIPTVVSVNLETTCTVGDDSIS